MLNFDIYKKEFRAGAINLGYSETNILKCLDYSEKLFENRVPIIYNITHLSKLTGYKRNYIVQAAVVSKYSDAYYRYYKIPKKKGGQRTIQEPLPNLKDIQHWILNNVLYLIPTSSVAKAYIKKRGLKENLKFHRNQKKVLVIDIENFFPSITYNKVFKVFAEVGYSELLCTYMAKLCCLKDKLPQGAPTSPYLSNLVLKHIDDKISAVCKEKGIRYTRYADDMTFSGDFEENEIIKFVQNELSADGYAINLDKTKTMLESQRQIVTGVLVNEKIQLPKEKRRSIRQTLYYINKFGLDNHVSKIGVNKRNYLNHLIGQVGFGLYINPNDMELKGFMKTLTKIQKELKL